MARKSEIMIPILIFLGVIVLIAIWLFWSLGMVYDEYKRKDSVNESYRKMNAELGAKEALLTKKFQ